MVVLTGLWLGPFPSSVKGGAEVGVSPGGHVEVKPKGEVEVRVKVGLGPGLVVMTVFEFEESFGMPCGGLSSESDG